MGSGAEDVVGVFRLRLAVLKEPVRSVLLIGVVAILDLTFYHPVQHIPAFLILVVWPRHISSCLLSSTFIAHLVLFITASLAPLSWVHDRYTLSGNPNHYAAQRFGGCLRVRHLRTFPAIVLWLA